MPNDMDDPYHDLPRPQELVAPVTMSGGVVVMATVVELSPGNPSPALGFQFSQPDGQPYPIMLLVMDEDQMGKLGTLIDGAAMAAIAGAKA